MIDRELVLKMINYGKERFQFNSYKNSICMHGL